MSVKSYFRQAVTFPARKNSVCQLPEQPSFQKIPRIPQIIKLKRILLSLAAVSLESEAGKIHDSLYLHNIIYFMLIVLTFILLFSKHSKICRSNFGFTLSTIKAATSRPVDLLPIIKLADKCSNIFHAFQHPSSPSNSFLWTAFLSLVS